MFSVISLQQNNDESVAANETVVTDAESKEKGGADEKSDQFVVTQEYIQDSMCPIYDHMESEKQF